MMFKQTAAVLLASAALMAMGSAAHADGKWTGFYAGVLGTGGLYQQTTSNPYYGYYGNNDLKGLGGAVGITLGANGQSGNFVYGIEGDASFGSLSMGTQDYYSGYYETTGKWSALATLRGRVGLDLDNTLIYATGGLAAANVDQSWCYYSGCAAGYYSNYYDAHNTGFKLGFTVGAGIEHALTNHLSVKAEYLYVGLPTQSVLTNYGYYTSFSSSANLARIGLNYKF